MADGFDEFARDCKALSRALSKLPLEIRRDMSQELKDEIAMPLMNEIGRATKGPHARILRAAVSVRANPNPTVVVGGSLTGKLSGGATARDVVFGTEFGGGNRVSTVNRERDSKGRKRRGRVSSFERERQRAAGRTVYKRHTTRQFIPAHPYIYDAAEKALPWVLEAWADVVMKKLYNAIQP